MDLETLMKTLLDFSINPCKSWGLTTRGLDNHLVNTQPRVAISQADRNTARLRSGAYTAQQLADFDRQCKEVETFGGTAIFDPVLLPDTLEFNLTCVECLKPFRSSDADAERCYDCCLQMICPPLPWRSVNHHWFYNDHEWTMEVFGEIGGDNKLTFWWHDRNGGGNTNHQALVVNHDGAGKTIKLALVTVARHARRCYVIEWDIAGVATKFFVTKAASVNQGYRASDEVAELEPLALDLAIAMIPTWMLYKHRPRNPANNCFA